MALKRVPRDVARRIVSISYNMNVEVKHIFVELKKSQRAPLQRAPLQRAPLKRAPLQRAPLQRAPLQRAPTQSTP